MATLKFKPRAFKITIDDPDEAVEFRKGLILAKQNNSSDFFPQLIDAVNAIIEPHFEQVRKLAEQGIGPDAGGRSRVEIDD